MFIIISAVSLQATLEANKRKLTSLDPCWKLEHSFLKDMLGEASFEKLQADFLQHMPTKEFEQELAAAVQGVRLVLSAQLFKFVPKPDQGQLNAAYELLARMQQGFAPNMPKNPNAFLTHVWARLPFFARATRTDKDKKTIKLTGIEAARHMLTELTKIEDDKLTFEDLEKVSIFSFLLNKVEEQTLQALVDKVAGRAGKVFKDRGKASSGMGTSSSSDQASSKRLRISIDEVEAAASMFR